MTTASSLPLQVLHAYFDVVRPLGDYLREVTAFSGGHHDSLGLVHETDTRAYRQLLTTCVVATRGRPVAAASLNVTPAMGHLREVVERAQAKLLTKSSPNLLTAGYRLKRRGHVAAGNGQPPFENYFANTLLTVFEASEWASLYERVGTDVMFHLLTETSMFVALPNDCFCQVVGEPIINIRVPAGLCSVPNGGRAPLEAFDRLKRKRTDVGDGNDRPQKRLRVAEALPLKSSRRPANIVAQTGSVVNRTPADISIARAKLFFGRANRAPGSEKVVFGFFEKHILNRLSTIYPPQGFDESVCDTRRQQAKARHLAKYIFPRQYGLPHPFVAPTSTPEAAYSVSDTSREAHIKELGACKTPKRLREAVDLVEKIIWRHGKCGYKPLLQKMCPSKLKTKEHESLDETVILEMMSESHSDPFSQAMHSSNTVLDSEGRSIQATGLSSAAQQVKQKPRFAEFMCSYAEVYRFAVAVTKTVIPMQFWGSQHNFKLVTHNIKAFIALRRYESLTLHTLLQGFRTADCEWLAPARAQGRVCVSDALKRLELLQDFIFWYFDGFLLPLLKAHFYVTESGAFRNRVLYFRHDDWQTLCAPLVEKLRADTFQRLSQRDAEEILRQRKLGFSFVRLLPKETGVRPIVNLRRKKVGSGQYPQSINQILKAAFLILQYEKTVQAGLFGASVLGPNEIYTKLKAYKASLLSKYPDGNFPKLYFVKLDVQACFDTIEQTRLLEILRDIISHDEYTIQRYGQVGVTTGQVRRQFVKKAIPADDHPHFLLHASKLAESLRHAIFVDQVMYPSVQRAEILELLEQHITDNIVKIGNDYYRQAVGIPQGSVLSTLLCSFFYGDLERRYLQFTARADGTLLRLIDDYLFVTTSYADAKRFLDVMKKGHPEYGCFISKDKTLTNFEDGALGNVVDPSQRYFPWCGFLLDMRDLSISKDYSRYHDTFLTDSLTVDRGRRPGAKFLHKMLQLSQFTSHIIFNDVGLNSTNTIYRNIYQNFLLTAMKMHHYVRSWKLDVEAHSSFLLNVIRQMIAYTYSTMRNKAQGRIARAVGGRCETPRNVVTWLGTHAFHVVLLRKSHAYAPVIQALAFELGLPRLRTMRRRFGKVVREGAALFALLSF